MNATATLLVSALLAAGCGPDAGDAADAADAGNASPPADRAASSAATSTGERSAVVTLGDRTWRFSQVSCRVIAAEGYVDANPSVSDDGTVRFEATHEPGGRTVVTIRDTNRTFQYSAGEGGGDAPAVTVDGRNVKFEGVFINMFNSTDRVEGNVELKC
jgi:hypothetical protein